MKNLKKLSIAILSLLFITSCSDDDTPTIVVEEEVITTMTVTLTSTNDDTVVTLKTQDLDGDGPDNPIVTVSENLTANTTYNGSIKLLNETESPAEDITEEVEELDEEHQFFFQASNSIGTFTYSDTDGDGNPVGLNFTLTTGSDGTGIVTIILRHEPNKSASGVSDGDITNADGETDIQADFPITVE